jgi:hypothetical protein
MILRKELAALQTVDCFSTFDPTRFQPGANGTGPCTIQDVCNMDWINDSLEEAFPQIKSLAPNLCSLLTTLMVNKRGFRDSWVGPDAADIDRHHARVIMVTSILFGGYAPQRSNFLSTIMGIYLHSSGVQRRVQDTLSTFGVTSSYKVTARIVSCLAKYSKV